MITPAYSPTATERVLPRLALDFTTGVLDSRVTVTRALNTATAINSSGYVATVNANLPRFDYNPTTLACRGLLIEEARTNSLTYSEQFDNAAWAKTNATVTADATASPANTTTADKLIATAVSGIHRVFSTAAGNAVNGTTYTFSVYAKAGEYGFLRLVDTSYMTSGPMFNLTNGTVSSTGGFTATITPAANGFYRCTASFTASGTALLVSQILVFSSASTSDYTGDGTSGIFIWGAQLEAGAFATSYIPTTTTSLTRNADVVTMTGTNFSGWYSSGAGAFQVATTPRTVTGVRPIIQADDASANNLIALRQNVADPELYIVSGGTPQTQIDAGTVTANIAYKLCGTWATDNCSAAKDGAAAVTDLTATIPTPTQLRIGNDGTNYGNMWVAKVNYWPQRVTNAETQAFSK